MKRYIIAAAAALTVTAFAADEITTQITLRATKNYLDVSRSVNAQWDFAASAPNVSGRTQLIQTNAEALTLGDVSTAGWSWFRNLATNAVYVEIGVMDANTNFLSLVKLKSGEAAVLRLSTNAPYARAEVTGGSDIVLEKIVLDD